MVNNKTTSPEKSMAMMNRNLAYMMSRVEGVSTNYFRLEPQTGTTASANQHISFALPSNALLNTRSFQLMFNATTSGAASGARLPPVERLIDRYTISSGGVQISQGYSLSNVLRAAKDVMTTSKVDSVLGHPEYVRTKSYVDGAAALAGTANEVYSADNNATQFGVCYFDGFLGTVQPSVIDTALAGSLTLSIMLAGAEVLSSVAGVALDGTTAAGPPVVAVAGITNDGAGGQSFTLRNIRLNVEVIGLASGVYDELVARRIAETGYISLPFKSYHSFVDSHTGCTRFSVSSQSLDRIWIAYRTAADAVGGGGLVSVAGYKKAGAFTSVTTGVGTSLDIGAPDYDLGGVLSTNREKYVGKFFNFSLDEVVGTAATFQIVLNGSLFPQFQANADEMYAITKKSVEGYAVEDKMTRDQYRKNFFVQCIRLNLPDSEGQRMISGIDSRNINLSGEIRTTNITPGTNIVCYAECTSILRIGANRSIDLVH